MIIKKVSTEQFAGIHKQEINLQNGLNIIYGKNEAGKSTIVNLISRVLFQNKKINKKSDKDFIHDCFPCQKTKNKKAGDFIDGTIILESDGDDYEIYKEWGDEPSFKLSTPTGILKNQDDANDIIEPILKYNKGVYNEMLLAPQKLDDANLQNIMDASKTTDCKSALLKSISKAFWESDGISIDEIEKEIDEKISELAGKHWDIEYQCPSNPNTHYKIGLGKVLEAMYNMEAIESKLNSLEDLESMADRAAEDYSKKEKAVQIAEEELNKFDKIFNELQLFHENMEKVKRYESDVVEFTEIGQNWPKYEKNLEKAKQLKLEKGNSEKLKKYKSAKEIKTKLEEITQELSRITRPQDEEINIVKSVELEIPKLENKLCGMNLSARIKMLGGNSVIVKSLRTGEILRLDNDNINITEAVSVEIPGVMEMQLSPLNVDAEFLNAKITESNKQKEAVLSKYNCKDLSMLESLAKHFDELTRDKSLTERQLDLELSEEDYATLEETAQHIKNVREISQIESDINELCDGDLDRFIGSLENAVKTYCSKFSTQENLKEQIQSSQAELDKAKISVISAENIDEKYRKISDPEQYKEKLNSQIIELRAELKKAYESKISAQTTLEISDKTTDELRKELENASYTYNEFFNLLYDWVDIKEAFEECKEELKGNPLQDLANNFQRNLSLISNNSIISNFFKDGSPDFQIASKDNILDYALLSDGTKGTVYLAYRLAILDYLFPKGGGVIVLDDPLNDMDKDRVEQSGKLIKEIAKRHQVIFLTCRDEYLSILGGNVINV